MANDPYFQGTCEVFPLNTCNDIPVVSEKFIDPCNCSKYYQCGNDYNLNHQICSEGTAWDSETNACIHFKDVIYKQPCKKDNVWTRCNVTESRLKELEHICTNETQSTSTTPQSSTTLGATTSDKINPGIIIGSIIGGAVLAVIVLIVAFILYRRRKQNRINKKKRQGTVTHNPEYFEGGQPDDPYAVINDHHVVNDSQMTDPTYNGSTLGGTMNPSNGSCTNTGFDGAEDVVYDNSGERTVGPGYTSTVRRSIREYETPTGVSASRDDLQTGETVNHMIPNLSASGSGQKNGNLYIDLNGNKKKSSSGNQSEIVGSGSDIPYTVQPGTSDYTKGHTHDDMPDYFVLEKSDT